MTDPRRTAAILLHHASEAPQWLGWLDQAATVLRKGGCDREADVLDRAMDRVGVDWGAVDALRDELFNVEPK